MSLFSDISGFSPKELKSNNKKYDNEQDYSAVDFCVNDNTNPFDFSATDVNFNSFNEEKNAAIDSYIYNFEVLDFDGTDSTVGFEG